MLSRHQPGAANMGGRIVGSTAALFLFLVSCQGMQGQSGAPGTSAGDYLGNCVKTGIGGIGGALIFEGIKQMGNIQQGKINYGSAATTVAIGAGAGCAVGLAYTAIGHVLNEREQKRHDEAFQQAARDGATQTERARQEVADRYKNLPPPATEQERVTREQEKARDLETAGNKEQPAKAWSEGVASGNVTVFGSTPVKTEGGATVQCPKIREVVMKDGKEVHQVSTACMGQSGEYQRVEVKPV